MSTAEAPPEGQQTKKERRVLRVDQIWSKKELQHRFVPSSKSRTRSHRFNKYPIVVRRVITQKGLLATTEVDIRSPKLSDVLIEVLAGVPELGLTKDPPTLKAQDFFSARRGLEVRLEKEEKEEDPDEELVRDVRLALNFLDEEFAETSANLDRLIRFGDITYDLLWTIFFSGMEVFTKENDLSEPQVVRFCSGSYQQTLKGNFYLVEWRMISHDGEHLRWSKKASIKIGEFYGTCKITDLAAYPFKFHEDQQEMRNTLVVRGQTFIRLLNSKCTAQEYQGTAVYQDMELSEWPIMRFEATGRIMVDPVAYRTNNPNSFKVFEPLVPAQKPPLPDHELIFCNCCVLGFSFSQNRWGSFAVSLMASVEWNKDAFDKLILAPKKRGVIRSLVQSHRTDASTFDDIVSGKGKGLVGLLTGSPGVGKTLTAEVVAEASERTLYRVTAGELGTTSYAVDHHLGRVLSFTARWNCVLLIDEADVFLHRRSDADLERNALCSIFLRRLEYFQGILILTTNKRRDIDEAFKSRIHFSFHYPELQKEDRIKIWQNFTNNVTGDINNIHLTDEEFDALAEKPLNGREIKNAVSCAASIVRAQGNSLTIKVLKDVLELLIDDFDDDES